MVWRQYTRPARVLGQECVSVTPCHDAEVAIRLSLLRTDATPVRCPVGDELWYVRFCLDPDGESFAYWRRQERR